MQLENKQPKNFLKDYLPVWRRPIFIAVSALILIAGYFLFLRGNISAYNSNAQTLKDLRTSVIKGQDQLIKAKEYSGKLYLPTALDRRIFDMVLADKADPSSLIEHLTVMANRAGFAVTSIDLEEANGNSTGRGSALAADSGKVLVRLKLAGGGYEELKNFIALAESSIMMTEISSINFTSKSPSFDISLIVYYYKPSNYAQK